VAEPQKTPDKPLTPTQAWQPFTPRGVAAFGVATLTRTILAQSAVAILVAVALVWFLRVTWVPVINTSIQQLPDTGAIRRGQLDFKGPSPQRLAGNSHLAILVDLAGTREAGHVADLEASFERTRVVFRGALGAWWRQYDPDYIISFNRPELEPWWGAWRWAVMAVLALAMIVSLFVMWWALALVYLPAVKFIAFFADRTITWRGAGCLSAAALLPGACVVALGLVLYGLGAIGLFHFALFFALHVVVGWLFVVTSPFFLPKLVASTPAKNPFGAETSPRDANVFKDPPKT
jgi:hypothetical protein